MNAADIVDLRSDFLSRPTEAMIDAMAKAARMPCGFGPREDPSVRRLEATAAKLLGKSDALFFPTCTMANQAAVGIFCRPGDSFIAEATAHMLTSESGAPAALFGAMPRPIAGERGALSAKDIAAAIEMRDFPRSRTAMICFENTHVQAGGAVVPLAAMREARAAAGERGLLVHLDGSRLFNAAAFLHCRAAELADCADTVSISLNKGLGAPVGALLAGSSDCIEHAARIRVLLGGGWRTAGVLAAAGIVALETMIDRIGTDHRRAKALAKGLEQFPQLAVEPERVETNIVIARLRAGSIGLERLAAGLDARGVRVLPLGADAMRMVTYHNIDDSDIARAIEAFASALSADGAAERA